MVVSRVKMNIIKSNIIILFITIGFLIIPLKSFKCFRAYNLLSNYILLITNEGIEVYDPQLNEHTILTESDLITGDSDIDYISFAQSPSDEGGYIYCRLKNYVFIYDESFKSYGKFEIKTANIYCVLNPYKTLEGNNTLIVTYINGNQKIDISIYTIDLNNSESPGFLYINNDRINLITSVGNPTLAINKGISCQFMYSSNYTNNLFVCFALAQTTYSMNALVIDPENSLEVIKYSNNVKQAEGLSAIDSALNPNQKESIVCIIDSNYNLQCLIYDFENNEFTDFEIMTDNCQLYPLNMGIKYVKERREYYVFCGIQSNIKYSFIRLDQNYNSKCNTTISVSIPGIYNYYSTRLLYDKNRHSYYFLYSCAKNNNDFFGLLEIQNCNYMANDSIINEDSEDESKLSSSTPTSLISSTSIIKEVTKIPTTLISSTSIKELVTTVQTSIIKEVTTIPTSIIKEVATIPTSIKKVATTIPTTIIKEVSTIPTSLISSTSIIKDTLPTSLLTSTLTDVASTTFTTKEKTNALNSLTSALNLENKSSSFRVSSTLLEQTIPKTIINTSQSQSVIKSEFSSSTIHSKISSFPSNIISTTDISLNSSLIFSSSPNTIFHNFKNDLVHSLYMDEDIIKGKIDKTKEELGNNLDKIMDEIEIGKKYEFTGNDYNLTITPINDLSTVKSTYVDISSCEEKLRKELDIPQDEILTILQIEIDKKNEKALTNQVEYAVYNTNREKLELSHCKDVKVTVNYEIKDQSVLNKTMIDYYSELGIDIFDSKDSFFTDLCYPFSISNSDIILKDRVSDIYQNYSLCDNGCEYNNIDTDNMTVSCICQVKEKINVEVSQPTFSKMIQDTIKNSNIGVIRCYNLVFDFSNKKNNYGFLVFLFLITFHIVFYIIYFINGIKYIVVFVFREMEKNNYLPRLYHPKRKSSIKLIKSENESSSFNAQNSTFIMKHKSEEKRKTFRNIDDTKKQLKNNNNITKNIFSKKKKSRQIIIFNYKQDNKYYKINKKSSSNSANKFLTCNKKEEINKKKKQKESIKKTALNEEKKWPGYYNLIQINANNSLNNKPPESKFILNNYCYELAIKYDNRDFWRILFICLLSKENILNTFFFYSPLESQPLRLSIFIFTYSCDFAFNALFYSNDNISEKYHYDGDSLYQFLLINDIVKTSVSVVVSYLMVKFLNYLTNSKKSIELQFREEEKIMRKKKTYRVDSNKKKIIYINLLKIYKSLKMKITCFIIIEFLIMIFFFYFITAFCEVYKDTQLSWLYDSFISFLLSLLLELLISIIISFLYITSIRTKNKYIYNIALFSYGIQ